MNFKCPTQSSLFKKTNQKSFEEWATHQEVKQKVQNPSKPFLKTYLLRQFHLQTKKQNQSKKKLKKIKKLQKQN
jgi:hypothetical protein